MQRCKLFSEPVPNHTECAEFHSRKEQRLYWLKFRFENESYSECYEFMHAHNIKKTHRRTAKKKGFNNLGSHLGL